MRAYSLDERGELSLYEYLYRRIRDDIVDGTLAADERLPSKRALAKRLGVSLITVEGAYAQLVAEGYVYARPRSGYFVSRLPGRPETVARAAPPRPKAPVPAASNKPLLADLTGASEAVSEDAARLWSRAVRGALAQQDEVFTPAPAEGLPRLREAIAAHLGQARGMEVDPSCVVVGAGAQVLGNMVVQLLGSDLTYAVEDPGYLRLTRIYRANGAQVRHIPLDGEGVRVEALAQKHADVLHLMPSHQFPTGRVTSIARRYELLGWASAAPGRYLVEDDYDCEFRLAGRPVPALASIDAAGRVLYMNTFSMSLGSALRLAYLVLPADLMDRYERELGFYSSTVGSVEQVALASLLEDGSYERHVARVRKARREVRDLLLDALAASSVAGRVRVEEADSGLHCVLAVESAADEEELAHRALEQGVLLDPLSRFAWLDENRTLPDGLRRFVVRYGGLARETVGPVVRALEQAFSA